MAFAYTVNINNHTGKGSCSGTYVSSGGGTGGAIIVPLSTIEHFGVQELGAAAIASAPVVNETMPKTSGTVGVSITIVTAADKSGTWWAEGY